MKKSETHDAVSLVDDIIEKAMASGASDIHFEPGSKKMEIKFRLDGSLSIVETIPSNMAESVVSRLKVLSGLLTYRNDIPQEGRISGHEHAKISVIDKRIAVFPTIHGQRAVIRLFYEHQELMNLDQLGFSKFCFEELMKISNQNEGLLLLTGPAGSGKSTTLAAMLRHILEEYPGKSIISLEDPVERMIDGVTQIQIAENKGLDFPTALRSLLRQDPEVLMLGEIRDAQTAKIAIEAALTGHLLMSTMHSGSPSAALLRLLEMGIEPYQITSSISAVLNQRLVRRLCEKCKVKEGDEKKYEAVGCDECLGTGYKGRVLISEIVPLDSQIRKALLEGTDLEELEDILTQRGHMTLEHDGYRLVGEGVTTEHEIHKVLGK